MNRPIPTVPLAAAALLSLISLTHAQPADAPAGEWVNVTNNVGGEKWGAYGVTTMKAVPNSNVVIAGVSEVGLWATSDGGTTWQKLGGNEIRCRPGCIVFDPKNTSTFWVSGCYGDVPFRSDDAGKTFKRLGKLAHADGISIDFADPQRQTLLLGLHEQAQSVQLSRDGGNTWTKIGANLPANSNHSSDPIIIDSKTFVVNSAGYPKDKVFGIYRTEDAGQTWTLVSKDGPSGTPLVASNGTIYWQKIWGGGLLKSADQGKTWIPCGKGIGNNPIELPGERLAGVSGSQIMVSDFAATKWTKVGPPIPFKPNGITYSEKGKAFYAWRLSEGGKAEKQSIVKLVVE